MSKCQSSITVLFGSTINQKIKSDEQLLLSELLVIHLLPYHEAAFVMLNCSFSLKLLMCDRCQRGYHVECLGPYYPTEPEGEDDVWVS